MSTVPSEASAREVPQVRPSHGAATIGAAFDDPSLTASAGLVPLFAPAEAAGLPAQATAHVEVQADRGANANLNAMSIETRTERLRDNPRRPHASGGEHLTITATCTIKPECTDE